MWHGIAGTRHAHSAAPGWQIQRRYACPALTRKVPRARNFAQRSLGNGVSIERHIHGARFFSCVAHIQRDTPSDCRLDVILDPLLAALAGAHNRLGCAAPLGAIHDQRAARVGLGLDHLHRIEACCRRQNVARHIGLQACLQLALRRGECGLDLLFRFRCAATVFVACSNALGQSQFDFVPARHEVRASHRLCALEDAGQRVVIRCRHRIELVVVTTRAGHRQPHEGARHNVELFIHHIDQQLGLVLLGQHLGPKHQEARRRQPINVLFFVRGRRQQIASQLLGQKAVVRFIAIEGRHDPITPTPGMRHSEVLIQAIRVGVARQIEPMARPTLTKAR